MREILQNSNIAIVGGGRVCKAILKIVLGENFIGQKPKILGVAEINDKAEGLIYAREKGIFTTLDYRDLYEIEGLDLIIELTGDDKVLEELQATKPPKIRLIDHFEAMSVWDFLQIEEERVRIKRDLGKHLREPEKIETEFDLFSQQLAKIVEERTRHLQSVERELVERERALSQIIQGTTIPTFVINKNHIVTHWNRACEKLTGYKAEEIVGTNKQWLPFRPRERPSMADVIVDEMEEAKIERYYGHSWRKSALIEGAYEAEEFFPQIGKNGKWLFFTAAPIKGANRETVGSIETFWDTTESKEAQLIQASKLATLGTLASGMAHELTQPLNVIQVASDFFLKKIKKGEEISDDELRMMAEEIGSHVDRASTVIKHMRDFARQSEVTMTRLNINEPIKDIFKVMGQQLRVHQIEVELDLDPHLPHIIADHNRLEQVLINLVSNAMYAMDDKGLNWGDKKWKRLLKIQSFSADSRVVVKVSDTGKGIPKEIIDKIFEPFFTTRKAGQGIGLGMSISHRIVSDYKGKIEVESEVDKGTTFTLKFPAVE